MLTFLRRKRRREREDNSFYDCLKLRLTITFENVYKGFSKTNLQSQILGRGEGEKRRKREVFTILELQKKALEPLQFELSFFPVIFFTRSNSVVASLVAYFRI
jgi:hypothetical protein